MSLEAGIKTKLNAWLAIRQRADFLKANISANKMNLPQGLSYTEREYYDGSRDDRQSSGAGSVVSYLDGRSDYYHYYYYYYYYYYYIIIIIIIVVIIIVVVVVVVIY